MTKETLKLIHELTTQEKQQISTDFVSRHTFINQWAIVELCFENELFTWDDVENMYEEDEDGAQEMKDILEWILVNEWVANGLREHGAPVLANTYGIWWGRTTSGQAYSMDTVIEDMALEVHYA